MLEQIKSNVIPAIITAAIIGVVVGAWESVFNGSLIQSLGGVTTEKLDDKMAEVERSVGLKMTEVERSVGLSNLKVLMLALDPSDGYAQEDVELLFQAVDDLASQDPSDGYTQEEAGLVVQAIEFLDNKIQDNPQARVRLTSAIDTAAKNFSAANLADRSEYVIRLRSIAPDLPLGSSD